MSALRRYFRTFSSAFRRRPRGTVRSMFSLSALALLISANIVGQEASYVKLSINDTAVEAGEIFSVDVVARAHVPVNAVDVTLRFDSNSVEVVSVDRGGSVLTIWTEDPVVEKNTVTLSGGTFRRGFIGEHKIATIDLRGKKVGESNFKVEDVMLLAGDGSGSPVLAAETNESKASLYIFDENTAPGDISVDVAINIISDIDGDGRVTLSDISAFMSAWADRRRLYDFNGDGRMSFRDFSIILGDYFLKR